MTIEGREYEQQATRARLDLEARLREAPAFLAAIESAEPPAVLLKCAQGHPLMRVQLFVGWRGDLSIAPVGDEHIEQDAQTATRADPLGHRGRAICGEPKCPKSVEPGMRTCEAHGSLVADEVEAMRTRYTCKQCGPKRGDIVLRQESLMKRYAAAVIQGKKVIRLEG